MLLKTDLSRSYIDHSADFYIRMAIEVRNIVAGFFRDLDSRFGHLLFHSPESEIEFGGDLPLTRSRFVRYAAGLFFSQRVHEIGISRNSA